MSEAAPVLASAHSAPLVEVSGVRKYFPVRGGVFGRVVKEVKAVDDVSFSIRRGETLGLVGESGSGKTTVGRVLLRLLEPTAGQIRFDGEDLLRVPREKMRKLRRRMQLIFQDPYASLNPRKTVGDAIGEPMVVHGLAKGAEVEKKVGALLERVGLPASYRARFPHEFSGGQRQRVCIARALALSPDFIVCDEAVSALDISIQAQILNLLQDLQDEYGITYLFISHNLNVVRHVADRIAVMYLGRIVEAADTEDLFANPRHPYTQALLSANPVPDPTVPLEPTLLEGEIPSPLDPPSGCRFHTRCPRVFEPCASTIPAERLVRSEHRVACHLEEHVS